MSTEGVKSTHGLGNGPDRAGVIDDIDQQVLQIFALVREALAGATEAFLATDRDAARKLAARDRLIDGLYEEMDRAVVDLLMSPAALAPADRKRLITVLRILPELERSGDLAEHIALQAGQGLSKWLGPRARDLVAQMGAAGVEMWEIATDAYSRKEPGAAERLRARDDEIDDLHVTLTAELAAGGTSIPVAIEMGLVARYFERLGDHAVNVARRIEGS
ncbi:MAG TPA: PhoU domain-containing protein [Acidimicrobiales bacterium]|nr:PhoU domain-containing protein [Acidimicrobiales bacterium]